MIDKFKVVLDSNNIKVDKHYSIDQLLKKLYFEIAYDRFIEPDDAQIQAFDSHGRHEMCNSADFRRIILPAKKSNADNNWTIARLLGAWINAKVDNAGNYNKHLNFLMGLRQLATIDRPRLANVNDIALKAMLPDELLDAVLPSDFDESDYGIIAKHFNVPIEQVAARIKQYENNHYYMGV